MEIGNSDGVETQLYQNKLAKVFKKQQIVHSEAYKYAFKVMAAIVIVLATLGVLCVLLTSLVFDIDFSEE